MTPHHHPLVRLVQARPRLFIAVMVTALSGWWVPSSLALHTVTRWSVAWNVGTIFYLLMAAVMMVRSGSTTCACGLAFKTTVSWSFSDSWHSPAFRVWLQLALN
jgi:hypothetical protein